MFWTKKKEQENDTNIALENLVIQTEALGINLRKQMTFADGAKISYININDNNIYKILDKYEKYMHVDHTAANLKIKHNLGRRGIISKDSEATPIVGKVSTFGLDFPYKMYYKNDQCVSITYYYPRGNREEILINSEKIVSKLYNIEHRLTKLEETYDSKIHSYEFDTQTNKIVCSVTNEI